MATLNIDSIISNIANFITDEAFVDEHSLDDFIKIMDKCELTVDQEIVFFNNLSRKFDSTQLFKLLQHSSINFGNDITQVRTFLHILGQTMCSKLFNCLSSFLGMFVEKGIKSPEQFEDTNLLRREISKNSEEMKFKDIIISTLRYENNELKTIIKNSPPGSPTASSKVSLTDELLKCSKDEQDFEKIYKILCRAAEEEDKKPIITAVKQGYVDVRDAGDQNQNILVESSYIRTNNFKLTKMLIENGADPNAKDESGQTALYCYCTVGNLEAVKYLCSLPGMDVNSPKHSGTTTLMIATALSHYDVVEYLVSLPGININARNKDNETALKRTKSPKIRELLIKHGAEE